MVSTGFAKVKRAGRDTFSSIESSVRNAEESTKRLKRGNDILGQSYDQLRRKARLLEHTISTSNSRSHIRAARAELAAVNRSMRGHAGAPRGGGMFGGMLGGMRGMMPMLGPAAAIAAIVGGGANVIGQGIEKFTEFQATNKSFEVLTGDKNIGQKLSKDLNKLQLDTILGPEVFKNAQTMLAFGIGAEEVIPSLKMLGDVSMGDAEKMKSLTLAFSQMRATGKLTGQDLLQMVNAGFNPLAEISRKTGKSLSELKDQMEKGNISSAMVTKAFKDATSEGGKFNNMLEQMKHTRKGAKAALEGQIEQDLITLGEKFAFVKDAGLDLKATFIRLITPSKNLQDAIVNEKNSINTLVGSITAVNQNNDVRLALLNKLKGTYPDVFGSIDVEKIKNKELLEILKQVNGQYDRRIDLALAQNRVNKLEEQGGEQFKQLLKYTEKYQASGGKYYGDKVQIYRRAYETTQQKLLSAQSNNEVAQLVDRVKSVSEFIADPTKMKGLKAAQQSELMNLQKGFASGKRSIADLERAESIISPSKITTNTPTGGTGDGGNGKSTDRAIAGSGPRIINIHGVKFMDKLELHTTNLGEGSEAIRAHLEEMFLRVLNSGARVQDN